MNPSFRVDESINWPAASELPGTTSNGRFRATGKLRVAHALSLLGQSIPSIDQALKSEFLALSYNNKKKEELLPKIYGAFFYEQSLSPAMNAILFPPLPQHRANLDLQDQLVLPVGEEAWVAFDQYQSIAFSPVPQNLKQIIDSFNQKLDADQKQSLFYFVLKSDNAEKRFKLLLDLAHSSINFSSVSETSDAFFLKELINRLEISPSLNSQEQKTFQIIILADSIKTHFQSADTLKPVIELFSFI